MKDNTRSNLFEELKDLISEKEAEELLEIAFKLNNLSTIRRSYEFKKAKAQKIASIKLHERFLFSFPRILIPAFAAFVILLGSATFVLAQKSLPGESLYTIKKAAENVIEKINPGFKQEIIQKKAEVNQAVEDEKKSSSEAQLKENKKEEETKENKEEKKTIINNSIEDIKNSFESLKEKFRQKKVDNTNKNGEDENEVKSNDVKGAEDKKIELNKEKENKSNNKNNKNEKNNKENGKKN